MKLINVDYPVKRSWLADQGLRLDASPYLSGSFEAKQVLKELTVRKDALVSLTTGHNGGIFNGPKFSRLYLQDPARAVRFLGSTDMMEADLSYLPLLATSVADKFSYLQIKPDTTLISCSGTIGRMAYVRQDMADIWSSQHIMKVQPDPDRIPPGYLNTFLRSRFGVPIITSQAYGAIIQHIEPHHIADLPVPRFGVELEQRIHDLVEEAANLRTDFQHGVVAATEDLFITAGLAQLLDLHWHEQDRDLGFPVFGVGPTSLRAMNYGYRARQIHDALSSVPHRTLGEICEGGQLARGNRVPRQDVDGEFGIPFVGQRTAFWVRPEYRTILPPHGFNPFVPDETVLVGAQGLPSENGLLGRGLFVTGAWLKFAFTEHLLRVVSGSRDIAGAYLGAFFRSEAAFRLLRSMMAGTGPQSLHPALLRAVPIPTLTPEARTRIAETTREAYQKRDEADLKEDQALALLESAVFEHAGSSGGTGQGTGAGG